MGAAVGYALEQSSLVSFAVFTALALGLAAPYLALTLQPAWARLLPRPGAWMEVLRQAVSVPIFGTVIWLAWVVAQAYGANLLAALLTGFVLLAIAGWFLGRWPAQRWATVVAAVVLLFVIWLDVLGPKKLVLASASTNAAQTAEGWQPWSSAAVSQYAAAGRPVFVDFTANWCLSCQVNERVALNQPEVQRAFKSANVVLMRADGGALPTAASRAAPESLADRRDRFCRRTTRSDSRGSQKPRGNLFEAGRYASRAPTAHRLCSGSTVRLSRQSALLLRYPFLRKKEAGFQTR
jgi:thiol:disulfide interchange protein